ncbi:MAG: hypothetical protein HHAS10_01900 [Candidatus Altimarinota bacterium]
MEQVNIFPGYQILITHISDGDMRDVQNFPHIIRSVPQVHGTEIVEFHGKPDERISGVDGIYTKIPNVSIGGLSADCPVILFMGRGEIAAVHSGWRGTKAHIIRNVVPFFENTPLSELKVYIGPHIQKNSYEVREDFFINFPETYIEKINDKFYFDIEAYLVDDLILMGIKRENIYSHGADTLTKAYYYSYRRDGMIGDGCISLKMIF